MVLLKRSKLKLINMGKKIITLVPDISPLTAEEAMIRKANLVVLKQNMLRAMECLNERERKILEMRFGFIDGIEYGYIDIGIKFNITRERARQIADKACGKLF